MNKVVIALSVCLVSSVLLNGLLSTMFYIVYSPKLPSVSIESADVANITSVELADNHSRVSLYPTTFYLSFKAPGKYVSLYYYFNWASLSFGPKDAVSFEVKNYLIPSLVQEVGEVNIGKAITFYDSINWATWKGRIFNDLLQHKSSVPAEFRFYSYVRWRWLKFHGMSYYAEFVCPFEYKPTVNVFPVPCDIKKYT